MQTLRLSCLVAKQQRSWGKKLHASRSSWAQSKVGSTVAVSTVSGDGLFVQHPDIHSWCQNDHRHTYIHFISSLLRQRISSERARNFSRNYRPQINTKPHAWLKHKFSQADDCLVLDQTINRKKTKTVWNLRKHYKKKTPPSIPFFM